MLLTIENVRIKEYDSLNVTVERYEDVFIPKEKKKVKKWVFKGYSRSVLSALLFIQRNELLIDKNRISDLNDHLKQVKESNNKILAVIEGDSN